MDMIAAAETTLDIWFKRKNDPKRIAYELPSELSYEHCVEMYETMNKESFSPAKLGRWLGWMQAACVANGCSTLEEMKEINKRYAGVIMRSPATALEHLLPATPTS